MNNISAITAISGMNRRDFIKTIALGSVIPMITMTEVNPFIEYATNNFKIHHWQKGIIPFEPIKHHCELADIYDNNNFVLVKKYRQAGFTTMTSLWSLYECITKPETKVLFISASDYMSRHCKRIVDIALGHMPNKPDFILSDDCRLILSNGSKISFMTPIQSCATGANYLIFDEAAFICNLDRWYKCLYPVVSSYKNYKILMVSTPNHASGYFYETYSKAIKGENKYKVYSPSCFEHDYTPERVKALKSAMGEKFFSQECLGSFRCS